MNRKYTRMRQRLNKIIEQNHVVKRHPRKRQSLIEQARETVYKAIAGQSDPHCKIPIKVNSQGKLEYCDSSATQACHSIQQRVLESISEDRKGIPTVLEISSKDPEFWQSMVLKHDFAWNIDRVPPKPIRPASASTRPFACNQHDSQTFAKAEKRSLDLPTTREPREIFTSDCQGTEVLEEQLFLLAYRAILLDHDITGSLKNSLEMPVQESNPTRRTVRTRMNQERARPVTAIYEALVDEKTRYDYRLLKAQPLELTHVNGGGKVGHGGGAKLYHPG